MKGKNMNSVEKLALLMKAKAFVKELKNIPEDEAVVALIEACGVIADKVHNDAFNLSKSQIIKFVAETKDNRDLALEIALLPMIERK